METPIKGKLILEDSVYEGDVVNYMPHGKGKKTFNDGSAYDGDWENGVPNGKGIFLFACGHIYKGDFSDGALTGKGKMKYADDGVCSYEGDYLDGKPHGVGKMIFSDGNICEGEFADGVPCGQSHWTFPKGLDIEDDENESQEEEPSSSGESSEESSEINLAAPVDTDDYDVVVNAQNEIMIVMYAREGNPDSPQAYRTADGDVILQRNKNDLIIIDTLTPETFEYFKKVSTILVNEIDNDGLTVNIYDVSILDHFT
ncbi:MAG: hypothetical protein FWB86_11755 [Treponema sp.]|nr:hypothetical protein [Treponema sp.]